MKITFTDKDFKIAVSIELVGEGLKSMNEKAWGFHKDYAIHYFKKKDPSLSVEDIRIIIHEDSGDRFLRFNDAGFVNVFNL